MISRRYARNMPLFIRHNSLIFLFDVLKFVGQLRLLLRLLNDTFHLSWLCSFKRHIIRERAYSFSFHVAVIDCHKFRQLLRITVCHVIQIFMLSWHGVIRASCLNPLQTKTEITWKAVVAYCKTLCQHLIEETKERNKNFPRDGRVPVEFRIQYLQNANRKCEPLEPHFIYACVKEAFYIP
jgi:hypothetical protein